MRVVVAGATGNVGTALLRTLSEDPRIDSIGGISRRRPELELDKVRWVAADISQDPLEPIFEGADAVIHLAWLIQPSRDESKTRATNVDGSRRVFDAVAAADVPNLVYASSVGAYSPGPKDRAVDESWPTDGVPTSFYARHKAEVERLLDDFEARHEDVRVVRLRPGLIFWREAATGIRRLFLGPLFPGALARPGLIAVLPDLDRLRFQAVHGTDVAEAYRLAIHSELRGAVNIAARPVLDPDSLTELLGARPIRVPSSALRAAASAAWRMRLQPTPPGWLDLALAVPIMDTTRAHEELGWFPVYRSTEALAELLEGLSEGAGYPTPPLDPSTSGPLRAHEFRTAIGAHSL
jgi:UDP-glucose 4-epimerase